MQNSFRFMLLGGAACLAAASSVCSLAQAQTVTFNGGGSSLAGPTYQTAAQLYTGTAAPNFIINYGVSSSGTGYTAFLNNADCGNYANGGCPGNTPTDFAASDAFMTSAQATALAGALGVQPIQIPMFATPITIVVNINSNYLGNTTATPAVTADYALNLTDNDLGLIFSGQVTNWASTQLSPNQPTVTLPNLPIVVVFRQDSSGTSNIFTTHLANALTPTPGSCAASQATPLKQGQFYNVNFGQGGAFPSITANTIWTSPISSTNDYGSVPVTGNNNFSYIFGGSSATVNTGCGAPNYLTYPSNGDFSTVSGPGFLPASGSGNVQTAVLNVNGAISYLSPDYTDIAPNNAGEGLPFVTTVNGVKPLPSAVKSALAGAPVPTTAAQAQNQQNYSPLVPNPHAGYPISGYTYWFLDQCYQTNASQGSDIIAFLQKFYGSTTYSNVISASGFSSVSSSNGIGAVILNNILSGSGSRNLGAAIDIGNATVCSGKGR